MESIHSPRVQAVAGALSLANETSSSSQRSASATASRSRPRSAAVGVGSAPAAAVARWITSRVNPQFMPLASDLPKLAIWVVNAPIIPCIRPSSCSRSSRPSGPGVMPNWARNRSSASSSPSGSGRSGSTGSVM